ncbi:hypothetical protein ACHHV8_03685 [Paenibacillus sp. TAB 01]|uniref:hypothetical protein n=1 Tax=Paenibacillus sp. TAB 01 TaxID=3368988 RepID=UPI003751B66B
MTYVPQIYPQPPEKSWLRSYETDYPTVVLNRFGKGQSVFFPYAADRNVWLHGHNDFSELLGNALDHLLEGNYTINTNAPVSVHFSLNQSREAGKYVLHAVNTTSAPRRPVLQTIPVSGIEAEIQLPFRQLTSFRVLYGSSQIECVNSKSAGGQLWLTLRIPSLEEYAAVYLEAAL